MIAFVARRLLATIPVLAMVALFVFLMLRLTPGDPAARRCYAGGHSRQHRRPATRHRPPAARHASARLREMTSTRQDRRGDRPPRPGCHRLPAAESAGAARVSPLCDRKPQGVDDDEQIQHKHHRGGQHVGNRIPAVSRAKSCPSVNPEASLPAMAR